jgi:inhibitor of KinA sporulation pathway (predicted exonuclease)
MSTPKKILVIDVEATCWEHLPPNKFADTRNEIIEIGITPIDIDERRAIGETRSILVIPPTTEISEFCTRLTTITPEMIAKDGIPFKQAIDILRDEYKLHRNVFASWGDYDRRSFEKNCAWNKVPNPISNMNLNVKALFSAKFGYNGGAENCAKDLGVEVTGTHHRGGDDSRNIAKMLVRML